MKTGKKHIILYVVLLLLVLVSCSDRRTVIGVSQCSDDIWRQKVNREIKIGQYQYKNVDVVPKQTDKTISEVVPRWALSPACPAMRLSSSSCVYFPL